MPAIRCATPYRSRRRGPWRYAGTILKSDDKYKGPGHHAFLYDAASDSWLIVYHRWEYEMGDGPYTDQRKIAIARVHYNPHGTIQPIDMGSEIARSADRDTGPIWRKTGHCRTLRHNPSIRRRYPPHISVSGRHWLTLPVAFGRQALRCNPQPPGIARDNDADLRFLVTKDRHYFTLRLRPVRRCAGRTHAARTACGVRRMGHP